ncbi:MAG: DNA polymerase III subunit delta [Elusimicrobiaceae bacterium]|nr:DNA polymerase III subunit delta [Elusimicrobiaceae bacterium]
MSKSTISKLQQSLAKGMVSPVYLLTGEDLFRKQEIIKKITAIVQPDDFNIFSSSADKADLTEVLALANTAPVFSQRRLVILTGIEKLRKDPKEAIIRYLQNPLETTVLILTHDDSKKFKTEKVLSSVAADHGELVNFDELKRDDLAIWVKERLKEKGLTGEFEAVETLCEAVGADLNALSQEIEKLALYTADRENKNISKSDVLAGVGFSKEENPFDLSNAVQYMNKNKAIDLIEKLLDSGEDPVGVLGKISYPVLKMARIKRMANAGMAPAEITRAAGLMFWENSLVNNARNFPSEDTFLKTLDKIIEADKSFKTSTASDPKNTLKSIIMTLFPGR